MSPFQVDREILCTKIFVHGRQPSNIYTLISLRIQIAALKGLEPRQHATIHVARKMCVSARLVPRVERMVANNVQPFLWQFHSRCAA
jgi:hypothetical protein